MSDYYRYYENNLHGINERSTEFESAAIIAINEQEADIHTALDIHF